MRFLVLLLALLLPLPLAAQTTTPGNTITVESGSANDDAIATRIRGILGQLDGYDDVRIDVSNGIVTLGGTVLDASRSARVEEIANRVEGVVAIQNDLVASTDLGERLNPALERFQDRTQQLIAFGPLLLVALCIAAAIVALGLFLGTRRQPWDRIAPNAFIADIYRMILRLVFCIVALVTALDILNATALLGTILGAAGIVGLAFGFAVKDTVENFIASIMLSIRQPFRPNDLIEIDGDLGKVIRLTSRATILLSLDGNQIRLPNATVFKSRIVNYTRNKERRFSFEVGVAGDADLAAMRTLAEETVGALPFTLRQPPPLAWIERIGDGAVFLIITGWIDQEVTSYARARGEALRHVKAAIEAAGVEVPDTTYRVQLLGNALQVSESNEDAPAPAPAPPPAESTAPRRPDTMLDPVAVEDAALERIVDAERADTGRNDLLSHDAKEE
ncbi:mechanosensitive ion channel domain-containing protein [Tropicimonas sp. IMCC34011]|uniref:mechanosensitive ion channel domain-containing protein n=1 Tax=Tropicimonas sp. IMCC34011 TaxID=2248759 RepID=UPI000E23D221|nr:mechanosensitive ion channel domain-containing protein [Tropicimonas sp. IMCC34011]